MRLFLKVDFVTPSALIPSDLLLKKILFSTSTLVIMPEASPPFVLPLSPFKWRPLPELPYAILLRIIPFGEELAKYIPCCKLFDPQLLVVLPEKVAFFANFAKIPAAFTLLI